MVRTSLLTVLCLGVLAAAGCRKRESPPPTPPAVPAEAPAAPVGAPVNAPVPVQPSAAAPASTLPQSQPGASENAKLNAQLTDAVARFKEKRNRLPASWQELVQGGFINAVPQPPPGKRFAIDPISHMVLEL
jgi:hypothetical protein